MNDFVVPILIISGLGLTILLIRTLQHVEEVNRTIEANSDYFSRYPETRLFLRRVKFIFYIPFLILSGFLFFKWYSEKNEAKKIRLQEKLQLLAQFDTSKIQEAPDPLSISREDEAEAIQYGRDLIAHTSDYLGPDGTVKPISNGMNCQNCHLDAGSKTFGNNYLAVASTYPKFRARSGTAETIYKRVNDCFQRSLNGQALDSTSREMRAIEAYIKWLGQAVPSGKTPKGSGLVKVKFLQRAANPDSGRIVFMAKCQSCHGADGQGLPINDDNRRRYPPLWGEKSYNEAAGLYRLSTFAGYVKANMPLGATYEYPQLTDAEAWDLAAFVNSQPRPKHPYLASDWPKIDKKPYDHPFGPFADSFPEVQHKLGPFQPIVDFYSKKVGK